MSAAPLCDAALTDRGHPVSCGCHDCMPPGADGAVDDALEAARDEMARDGVRGAYAVRSLARTTAVTFTGGGSRTDIARAALRAAERQLVARGCTVSRAGLELFVAT